jgi:formate hydrogenlyase subunit 3/multisubunit Na+/H+ antiporter MnhD subunit
MDNIWLTLSLIIPIVGIFLIPLLPHRYRAAVNFILVFITAITTSVPAVKALNGSVINVTLPGFSFFGNILLRIDNLSAWFILIINLTCINGALYGIGYMTKYTKQCTNLSMHWMLFLLFQSSMLWVCIIQNALAFLIVWELMSISSFLLVIFEHQNKSTLQAGINYLVQMHIGVLFLTAAFIWVYFSEGSFEFSAIENFFASNYNVWLFLLFFIGFGVKAGFIPLHSWLPQAHPAAPSHVSGVMSGVIVKLGIYGIFRIVFLLKQDYTILGEILLSVSVLTGLYGILNAAVHRDFKRMLAYCTIENIGIIGMGIGVGLLGMGNNNTLLIILGFGGALLHVLNHSLFKSLLFFSAGSVYQQTHTRDMEKLGGLIKSMPQTATLFLMGSLAISGLPPLNGFVSEFILYNGFLNGIKLSGLPLTTLMISSLAGFALIGGISMLTFTKSFGTIFLGSPRTHLHEVPKEVMLSMRIPQYCIIVLILSVGLFPQFYFSVVSGIVLKSVQGASIENASLPASLLSNISAIGKYSLLFIALLIVVYVVRKRFIKKKAAAVGSTWGCGYTAANPRMQYTGKSFSKSLGKLLGFVVMEKKKYKEIETNETFPHTRKYSSHYNDFFETVLINPVVDRLVYAMNYFRFIQNGRLQMYMLYGIFFIVLIFLGTIFKMI